MSLGLGSVEMTIIFILMMGVIALIIGLLWRAGNRPDNRR